MYNYLPHDDNTRQEMLESIGLKSVDQLFANIPQKIRTLEAKESVIPEGMSEAEAQRRLQSLASKNKSANSDVISFLGGGAYNRYVPACVPYITGRSEFLTSYTPYQPEVSQGTLQAMYEYQSMICNLTGMDVANASVYDAATACAEAILMASRITNRFKALVSDALNPEYKEVIKTYCYGAGIELTFIPIAEGKTDINSVSIADKEYSCVLIQHPNYLGNIEDADAISEAAHTANAKLVACVDPVSLAVLKSPAEYGADIVCGDVQSVGIPMSFGGPHGGFLACRTEHMRQIPGRIAGMTVDQDEERAFTLTLQAREQHIRRAKATSNICSNQALVALSASVYLAVAGYEGLREVAETSAKRARYLAGKINGIKDLSVTYNDYLYEFVVKAEDSINLPKLLQALKSEGVLGGILLDDKVTAHSNCMLVCVTEMNTIQDIETYTEKLSGLVSDQLVRA